MSKSKKGAVKPSGTSTSGHRGTSGHPAPVTAKAKKGAAATKAPAVKAKPAGKSPVEGNSTAGTPPAARKWPKGGPTKADLKRYRQKLVDVLKRINASSNELASEALKSSGQDFSVDHMADHGSDNYEQDFSLSLLEGESAQLTEIRDALAKIEGGAGKGLLPYGLCEACADEPAMKCPTCPWIPPSRLDAVPHARLCVQMKEQEERRRP